MLEVGGPPWARTLTASACSRKKAGRKPDRQTTGGTDIQGGREKLRGRSLSGWLGLQALSGGQKKAFDPCRQMKNPARYRAPGSAYHAQRHYSCAAESRVNGVSQSIQHAFGGDRCFWQQQQLTAWSMTGMLSHDLCGRLELQACLTLFLRRLTATRKRVLQKQTSRSR